jgi:hypothetical protein
MHGSKTPEADLLISLRTDFSDTAMAKKQDLLKQVSGTAINDAALLRKYHECLLFLLAYPGNKDIYKLALQQLQNIKEGAERIFSGYSPKKQTLLNGTGIYSSELVCAYSYDIAFWLCQRFGNSIGLHSTGADAETVSKILESFLPAMEYQEITQTSCSLLRRIQKLTGQKNNAASLRWLLESLQNKAMPLHVRNSLYEQLQVYVYWKLDHPFFNRTFLRSLPLQKIYYRKSSTASHDYNKYIRKKIKEPFDLSPEEKKQLLDIARAALALHNRETDPVSFGDSSTVKYFDMGNGISIALYTMLPQNRFSIESYIGYMAFVNSVPTAYGGGWLLGQRCKIGINIFPVLRGGHSTLLFASILRLYHRYYQAQRFVVKPYQFGKNNPDGLRSGSFWFYYKLGFRPSDPSLLKLAKEEYAKKASVKNYRTSLAVLKKFTASPLELLLHKKTFPGYDAGLLSKAVTKNIIQHFKGNRQQALKHFIQQLKNLVDSTGYKLTRQQYDILTRQAIWMALLFPYDEKTKEWTKAEKKQFIRLLLSKFAQDEKEYITGLQQHKKLWKVLNNSIYIKS